MREMGKLSGVEIEPEQQTKLLDASVSMAGVIGGGVPGGKFPLHPLSFSSLLCFIPILNSWRVRCRVVACL